MLLTDTDCENAKPKKTRYKLACGGGLCLQVTPEGGKYWVFRYRAEGKEKNRSLGVFPIVSLSEARAARDRAKRLLKNSVASTVHEVGENPNSKKRAVQLTDAVCRNAKGETKRYRLADSGGLCLRVWPNGGKYWILRYRIGGKEKNLSLGIYPDVSLVEARDARDAAKHLLNKGVDPAIAKLQHKLKNKTSGANDFESVAVEWIELKKLELSARYIGQIESRLRADIIPELGRMPVGMITPPMLLNVLRKVQSRGTIETMHRLKQYCGMIFRYAIACGKADRDPSADIRDALPSSKKKHFAAIDSEELPEMLLKMSDNTFSVGLQTRLAMRALLLTFVRTKELIEAKKKEINFDTARWVIPAERMKMKRDHIVPLSRQAIEIFKTLSPLSRGEYMFPGQRSWLKPMSNMAILMGLKRMGYKGKMTGHGFRALAMTTLRETLEFPKDIIDLQLAHAKGKVDAAYDRAKFLKERAVMMQAWADYIDETEKSARKKKTKSV